MAGAVVEVEPRPPQVLPREGVELRAPSCRGGTRRAAMAMWPLSTRVKPSTKAGSGSPTQRVRVMSVVPSSY